MPLIPLYTWNKNLRSITEYRLKFHQKPWAQGSVLLICVIVAMLLANLPFTRDWYQNLLGTTFHLNLNSPNGVMRTFPRDMTVASFINDVLMTIFFFSVGLEIRREIAYGELSSPKKAILPIVAAFGGVILPAVIFTVVNHGTLASTGWGIPTATDIAFAVCILTVLGDKVPVSLKVFLTALAIADDLIAILVVALFYGGSINGHMLVVALLVVIFGLLLRRIGEKHGFVYILIALIVWTLFYYSGIHSTMSGVVMAFLIPNKARYNEAYFIRKMKHYTARMNATIQNGPNPDFPNGEQRHILRRMRSISDGSVDMSKRVEHALNPWVNFLIMPLFALANAGVQITDASYFNVFQYNPIAGSVSMGIFLGLVLGKPIGITLTSWLAIKLKVAAMPDKANWAMFFAVACLGGIGFTMSIFVDTLSFKNVTDPLVLEHMRDAGKIAVLIGSVTAGILGSVLVNVANKLKPAK